jgi:ABC-type transporter Mla subunit MlaD
VPNINFFLSFNQEQQAKLANLKYVLQETTEASNDLLEQTPVDDNANTEIPEQVTKVNDLYAEVNDLLDGALTAEKENLAKHGEFETLLDSFADKVDSLEKRLEDVKPLSTKLPELKAEQEELAVSPDFVVVY